MALLETDDAIADSKEHANLAIELNADYIRRLITPWEVTSTHEQLRVGPIADILSIAMACREQATSGCNMKH